MVQSITDRITLHTQLLADLDIREFYRKQQELLSQIAENLAMSTPRSGLTSLTRPTSAHSSATLPHLRPLSAASTTPTLNPFDGPSPPDSPVSRVSSHAPSVALSLASSEAQSALSRSSFMSELSQYSSILPKNILAGASDITPIKKSSRKAGPSHKHRLQTSYTINEAGERVYTMSALAPDPVAELDIKNGYEKNTGNENEKIIYR